MFLHVDLSHLVNPNPVPNSPPNDVNTPSSPPPPPLEPKPKLQPVNSLAPHDQRLIKWNELFHKLQHAHKLLYPPLTPEQQVFFSPEDCRSLTSFLTHQHRQHALNQQRLGQWLEQQVTSLTQVHGHIDALIQVAPNDPNLIQLYHSLSQRLETSLHYLHAFYEWIGIEKHGC